MRLEVARKLRGRDARLSHAANALTQITFIISRSVYFFATNVWSHTADILALHRVDHCRFARNGDTRRAYCSTFDRASSRWASTRRDASVARTLGKVVGRYNDRTWRSLSRNISSRVCTYFRPVAPPLYYFVRTHSPHFRVRKSSRGSRVAQHSASLFHVNGKFESTIERI